MFNIYNKYGFDRFEFEGYEIMIMRYSDVLCSVNDMDSIRVNQQFMNLDENTQKFILYHELGHIYHGHNKQSYEVNARNRRKRRLYAKFGLVPKEEIQADLYAVKMLGKENALKALNQSLKSLKVKEFITRKLIVKIFG